MPGSNFVEMISPSLAFWLIIALCNLFTDVSRTGTLSQESSDRSSLSCDFSAIGFGIEPVCKANFIMSYTTCSLPNACCSGVNLVGSGTFFGSNFSLCISTTFWNSSFPVSKTPYRFYRAPNFESSFSESKLLPGNWCFNICVLCFSVVTPAAFMLIRVVPSLLVFDFDIIAWFSYSSDAEQSGSSSLSSRICYSIHDFRSFS